MTFLPSLPEDGKLIDVFQAFPDKAKLLLDYHEALLRGPSPLSLAQRELIAGFVSGLNACNYCHGVHRATASAFGIDEETLAALLEDVDTAPIDEAMKPLMRYVRKVTLTPSRTTPSDAQAVFDAGWSEQALYDAVSVCALFNFMNRLVDGLGVTADEDYLRFTAERLVAVGYALRDEL